MLLTGLLQAGTRNVYSRAAIGAGLGAGLGAATGAFLTKGATSKLARDSEEAQQTQTSFIGGDQGFVNVEKAKEASKPGVEVDTSTTRRKARDVLTLKESGKKKAKDSGLPIT